MLLRFKVSNFMSIKEEVIVNAVANSAGEHEYNNILCGKDRILPAIGFYGYNAVGKSNIFKALTAAILLIRSSNYKQVNEPIQTTPFLLDDSSRDESTKMDFLYIHNGRKFNYGFEITQKEVLQEYLYEYVSARPSLIFERTGSKYVYTTQTNKELEAYENKNTSNKLFLCTATAWNCQLTKDAFLWFSEGIDTYDSKTFNETGYLDFLDEKKDDTNTKEFFLNVLKHTDFNISDYIFESRNIKDLNLVLPPGVSFDKSILDQMKMNAKEAKLESMHEVEDSKGNKNNYPIDFPFESNGTKMMFSYAPIIHDALEKGRTIVVDEIDNSLHPLLTKYLIQLFINKDDNKNGAQLLFNFHDSNLMDNELLRRDQLYFVEKDKAGQTRISNLYEHKARRNDNFRKGYFDGKYIDLPNITEGLR